jgi:hypothetical protein
MGAYIYCLGYESGSIVVLQRATEEIKRFTKKKAC